jgi:hypothetical protein
MSEIVIDNSIGLVMVNGKVLPRMLLGLMRGAVGKSFVVKHYKGRGRVVTRFPDLSGIVATEKQKVRRDLFREAVVWAKWVIGDEHRKLAFRNTLPRKKRKKVYQAALQMYIREKGNKLWLREQWARCNRQLANEYEDVRKQLAEKAVVESGKCEIGNKQWTIGKKKWAHGKIKSELLNGKGVYGQRGPWRVLWQKRSRMVDMMEQEPDFGCLGVLRI